VLAVNNLTFNVEKGSILGFVGPNGAGKTTTIRILTGLLNPTSGSAWINGYDVKTQLSKVKRSIGYLPQDFGLYDYMRVYEYLDLIGKMYGIRSGRKEIYSQILETVGLDHLTKRKIATLSTGEKQRLGIAQTIVHDPEIIFLDEPTSSLDPIGRREVYQVLRKLIREGKTVFISSHILAELAKIITDVVVIKEGNLLFSGSVKELLAKDSSLAQKSQLKLSFEMLDEELIERIKKSSGIKSVSKITNTEILIEVKDLEQAKINLIKLIANSNSILDTFTSTSGDLEDIILEMIAKTNGN
jgi:ABC-2 type transport system ATP-binding protein